jgi:hypothetical protein
MYCVKCGVELADTEESCPLCQTRVYHPDLPRPATAPLYPTQRTPAKTVKRWSVLLVITILYLVPISICLVSDLAVSGAIEWSGYVTGALLVLYTACLLPAWFEHPNPVIFVPIAFGVVGLFLLYIDLFTKGGWFLPLAFPVTGYLCLLVTAVVTLCRYIRKARLFIFGGATIALGVFCVLLELLLTITFPVMPKLFTWSLYPLTVLTLLGLAILATAIFRPMREALEKKFFL